MRMIRFDPFIMLCLLAFTAAASAAPLTLRSAALTVTVDGDVPRILNYRHELAGGDILGSLGRGAPSVQVRRNADGRTATVEWSALMPKMESSLSTITWHCAAQMDGVTAATFDWVISVSGEAVEIATMNIVETKGYDIVAFRFPADPIIRVTGEQPGARAGICNLNNPGVWLPAGESLADRLPVGRNQPPVQKDPTKPVPCEFALVTTDRVAAGIYANHVSAPYLALAADGGTGVWLADFRYSFKNENYEPFYCKIGIVADRNGDGKVDWQDACIAIHSFIPKRVNLRTDAVKYMANHGMNFAEFSSRLRELCYLLDGYQQICLLSGWNGWGWDSEYPSYDFPGEEYGGREGLYKLHNEARRYNVYTSMIHNFDDAYKDSKDWDPAIIAVRENGALWDATWWSGGPSFIISPYKFWKTGAAQRTIDTLIEQGVERQIFSDVFNIIPYRPSYDKGDESDALDSLVLGKLKILDYFRQRDIYMNSEGFCYEMLGRVIGGHNGFNPGISDDPTRPPISLFISKGLMTRKFWSVRNPDPRASDEGRFCGGDTEILPGPTVTINLDACYTYAMLIGYYGEKPMTRFSAEGQRYTARYGDDVDVVWERGTGVWVYLNGRMIANPSSVLLPKPGRPNVFRAYSLTGEPTAYPKPSHWTDFGKLVVMRLTAQAPPQVVQTGNLVKFDGDRLVLNLPKGVPHKLVYGPELIGQEQTHPSLPPKFLLYPLDEVIQRQGGEQRPAWVLRSQRKALEPNASQQRLGVGCSATWPTLEDARRHAASIVARKIAWFVRRSYVWRSRGYEQAEGFKNTYQDMGYDNWYLGHDAATRLYTLEAIDQRPGTQWYAEQVRHGHDRSVMWKAFVATPITAKDMHDVYVEALKLRLAECREQLAAGRGNRQMLERNIRVYERALSEEPAREPIPLDWDMW